MALAEGPFGRLADRRKGLDEEVVDLFAGLEPRAEHIGARAQRRVVEGFQFGLERVDRLDVLVEPLQISVIRRTEGPCDQTEDHTSTSNPFVLTSPAESCS